MGDNGMKLLVIGEGLAGITAAASAVMHGAQVTLASKGPGSFVLGTAALDLEGISAFGLSTQKIEEAVAAFVKLTTMAGFAYNGGIGSQRWLPTITGNFLRVSLAPNCLWKGDPTAASRVVIAGMEDLAGFDPHFLAERLTANARALELDTSYRAESFRVPEMARRPWKTAEVAQLLQRDRGFRKAWIAGLRRLVREAELLLIPGMLGIESGELDLAIYEEDIGCAI